MRRTSMSLACLFVVLFIALAAMAQMPMPKPATELSKLDYFAGNWSTDTDMKPGPMGPGGKVTSTGDANWMDGKFFLVIHSKFKGAMGDGTSLAVMGFDADKKVYTYHDFDSMGQAGSAVGSVDGDTWTFTSDENFGGQAFKGRYTMKIISPTSYTFKYEMSKDGTEWMTMMDGKATKK